MNAITPTIAASDRPAIVDRMADAILDRYAANQGVGPDDLVGDFTREELNLHFNTAAGVARAGFVRQSGDDPIVPDTALGSSRRNTSLRERMDALSLRRFGKRRLREPEQDIGLAELLIPLLPREVRAIRERREKNRKASGPNAKAQAAVEARPDPERMEMARRLVAGVMPNEAELHLALRRGGFENLEIARLWPELVSIAADDFAARMGGE